MKEIWKSIPGYENTYEVSSYGRVRSIDRVDKNNHYRKGKILKTCQNSDGYLGVSLYKNGKSKRQRIHKLVMQTFVGNQPKGKEINHIDENKTNNRLENLEYVTHLENMRHGTAIERMSLALKNHPRMSKKVICVETGKIYESTQDAYRKTGIRQGNICNVCNGKLKTAGGYHWEYERV